MHDALLDMALIVPAYLAVSLVPKVIEGIHSPYHLTLAMKIGDFISYLANGGQGSGALQIAGAGLEIIADTRKRNIEPPFNNLLEPRARFSLWEYEQILTRAIPSLAAAVGEEALILLCDLLDRAITLSNRQGTELRPNDFSEIWRSAIEEHPQNFNAGFRDLLVTAVRDAAEQNSRIELDSVSHTVEILNNRGRSWRIFRRIALHLLRIFWTQVPLMVRDCLLDRGLFDASEVRHEYFLLEKECFGLLVPEDQNIVLGWINEGPPDLAGVMQRWTEATGKSWTADDRAAYVRQWQRDRLAPLEKYLDAEWSRIYGEMCALGRPEHPEFMHYHQGGAFAPASPRNQEDLAKLAPKDLVGYVLDWKPTGDWFRGPSPEGLAREITSAVSGDPQKYAADAEAFRMLSKPIYVNAIVQGFQDALRGKRNFDWSAVLDFCVWAVGQPVGLSTQRDEDPDAQSDGNWGWIRTTVARLLTDAFGSTENPIPIGLREKVWLAIEAGTNDPEPTAQQEDKYLRRAPREGKSRNRGNFDPFTNAINTPRGVAMEAVVRYGLWLRNTFENSVDGKSLLAQGFGAMPGVQKTLDVHLDLAIDPSITIRTIYGYRAPWLQLMDEKWATENTGRIFSRNSSDHWHAAWDTYVTVCQPYDKVFDWLRDEYSYATEQIGRHDHGWGDAEAPDFSLARHLMAFYWRGKLDPENDLLDAFYHRAGGKLRAHALNFVGVSLRNTPEPLPGDIAERLKRLWMKEIGFAKQSSSPNPEELKEFGWWFASRKFDDEWSINQLLEALRLGSAAQPDHLVVEQLVAMCPTRPSECIEALSIMIEGDTAGWAILGWQEKAENIIKTARGSGIAEARVKADELINLLGSRGLFSFGKLLNEPI